MESSMNDRVLPEATRDYFSNINNIDTPIFILNPDCYVKDINKSAAMLHGIEPDLLINKNYLLFCTDNDLNCDISRKNLRKISLNNNKIQLTTNYPSGKQNRFIKWTINALYSDDMTCVGYVFIGRDITLDKYHADNLSYLHHLSQKVIGSSYLRHNSIKGYVEDIVFHLNNIIAQMPGSVYWKDRDGRYLGGNKNVATMMGLNSIEEFIGKTDLNFAEKFNWPEKVATSFAKDNQSVLDGKPILGREEPPFHIANGKEIIQLSNRVPLLNKNEEVIGILGVSVDITDKKRAEQLEKEKQVAENTITQLKALAGGIAHQITNPLAGIKSAFGYIERKFPQLIQAYKKSKKTSHPEPQLSSQQIENIEFKITQIKQRIDKTQYIIDHHLMNIKSNYNKLLIDTTSIKEHSITSIIEETLSDFPFIEQQKTLVHWQGGEDFKIYGVKFLLVHVLNNLIDNALDSVHFSNKSDAKVTIWLEQDKATHVYRVHIKDTGLGLPHSGRADLFKPFHTKRNNGTGLGLYFCKTVMEAHHGRIIVRGKDGEYAQFTLIFPNPKEFSAYRRRAYKKLLMAQ